MDATINANGDLVIDWQKLIFEEIANPKIKRKDVAQTYHYLIVNQKPDTDWSGINHAIMNRWSLSALLYIKNLAWSGKAFDEQ